MLSQSNSVQNLSSLTLKTKELWGGWKTSPMLHQPKKPSAYRVKRHNMTGNRTLSLDNVKDNCSKKFMAHSTVWDHSPNQRRNTDLKKSMIEKLFKRGLRRCTKLDPAHPNNE